MRSYAGSDALDAHRGIESAQVGNVVREGGFNDARCFAQVVDAAGAVVVPETGSSKIFDGGGRATGSFFHLIAEAT